MKHPRLYKVWHGFGKYADERAKIIGIFQSKTEARRVVAELKYLPGFRDGGRFTVSELVLDRVGWVDGFIHQADDNGVRSP